jgi:hypothetical protein
MLVYDIKSKNGISYTDWDIQRALDKMFGIGSLEVDILLLNIRKGVDTKRIVCNHCDKILG